MIKESTARNLILSMPEAVEGEHMNHPDFRVRKKIFATLWPDESKAVVFVDPETHDELVGENPDAFSLNGWSAKYGALTVHLKHVSKSLFQSLVRESWARKAPKALVAEHSGKKK